MPSFISPLILALRLRMRNVACTSLKVRMAYSRIGGGHTVFCNPPYGKAISDWVRKCYEESKKPNTKVVMLIPARTDTKYFHEYIYHKAEIRFIRGRLHFNDAKQGAPFPSMVVIF